MNVEAIDADFLARHLGRASTSGEVQDVRTIVNAYAENLKVKATTLGSSESKRRARRVIRYVRKLDEAVRALELGPPPVADADLWTRPPAPIRWPNARRILEVLDHRRVRALLVEIASAAGWINQYGLNRAGWGVFFRGKGPNWPLGYVVAELVEYFTWHASAAADTAACDRFVIETLMASGVVAQTRDDERLIRDYLRKVFFDPTGSAYWNPGGVLPS